MSHTKNLLKIGFRRMFNKSKFNSIDERAAYIAEALVVAQEVGLDVSPIPWNRNAGKKYYIAGWIIDGKQELEELLEM